MKGLAMYNAMFSLVLLSSYILKYDLDLTWISIRFSLFFVDKSTSHFYVRQTPGTPDKYKKESIADYSREQEDQNKITPNFFFSSPVSYLIIGIYSQTSLSWTRLG